MNSGKVYLMNRAMQKQEDPLNLRSLPLVSPEQDGWPAIEATLRQDRQRRANRRFAVGGLAIAATVTLVLGLVLRQPVSEPGESGLDQTVVQAQPTSVDVGAHSADSMSLAEADTLDALIGMSQQLEGRLRKIRSEVGDLPTGALVYQVELEDLVVQVDDELSSQPDSLALWNQRVSLLMDIERLYENSMRRKYRQIASL
jgi:hypothetical protein